MESFLFYFFSGLAVLSALVVILHPKPTRSLLALIVTMTALSIIYLVLGAYFVAVAQLIVYAGAVLVLFLFVIMLQGVGATDIPLFKRFHPVLTAAMALSGIAFAAVVILAVVSIPYTKVLGVQGSLEAVGRSLFTDFLLPFELTAVLLLLSVFAAVALAKDSKEAK